MRPVPWGELVALVRRAGEAILPHWRANVAVRSKADESPVTAADLAALAQRYLAILFGKHRNVRRQRPQSRLQ
ncbi:hypothetical protein LDY98_02255, partial [Pseudomonas aeruginosa]|nr:hypothetical protein [Pseudomonas aeruginosa]